ncbi:YcjF family protein [Larsenimonas rhizosphaerae]|uniref:TIGR01620 family protein n=1 Tax=Larsenimonas rhizosphaerae TaxID=2944682 RepID=A0AA41ZKD5_9GAMM|nr:TIGR01620 family protein [Larsenimonas rhizosphaerae]MCM2130867.1 YcjF family protein [Larsenimonas rhizosphaerae]MCX2523571.1 TIGR01620 family protein [Larsenimonas rhizosphaerae]
MTDPRPPRYFEMPETDTSVHWKPPHAYDTTTPVTVWEPPASAPENGTDSALDRALARPGKRRRGLFALLAGSLAIGTAQCGVAVYEAWQYSNWFSGLWAGLGVLAAGFLARGVFKELKRLSRLRRHARLRERLEDDSAPVGTLDDLARHMGLGRDDPHLLAWQQAQADHHDERERQLLFEHHVLAPRDREARRLITRMSTETAALVAISPMTLLDMGLMAWRNVRMIDRLARLYGLELGYASRLTLCRHVLSNMAFAGASEIAVDMGAELVTMNLAEKLSSRAAQGLGSGLLSARLGLRTQRMLRPLPFREEERPRISHIRRQLWQQVKGSNEAEPR